jgi:hypothetical protein
MRRFYNIMMERYLLNGGGGRFAKTFFSIDPWDLRYPPGGMARAKPGHCLNGRLVVGDEGPSPRGLVPVLGPWVFDPPPYLPPPAIRKMDYDAILEKALRPFIGGDAKTRLEVQQVFLKEFRELRFEDYGSDDDDGEEAPGVIGGGPISFHHVTNDTTSGYVGMILDLLSFALQQGKPGVKRVEAALSNGSSTPNGDVGPTRLVKNPPGPLMHRHRGLKLNWHSDAKEAMWRRLVMERPRAEERSWDGYETSAAVDLEMAVIDLWRHVMLSLPLAKKAWNLPGGSLARKKAPQILGWVNLPVSLDKAMTLESPAVLNDSYSSIWLGGDLVVRLRNNFAGKRRTWLDMEEGWPAHVARRVLEQGALEPLAEVVLDDPSNAFAREVLDRALAQATHRYVNEPDPFRAAADRLRELRYDGRRGAAHVYERLLGLV